MERVEIVIEIEDIGSRRANVNSSLHIAGLIDAVRNRYNLLQGAYALVLEGESEPLDPGRTLEQHGITQGDTLIFIEKDEHKSEVQIMIEKDERQPINDVHQVYFQDEREGLIFELEWQPAIIGRADQRDPSQNKLLAVDLSNMRGSEYVSRRHACVIEKNGQYYVESLNARNPTYINNETLDFGRLYILQPGDRVQVGRMALIFNQSG